jgi:hypothetical protein
LKRERSPRTSAESPLIGQPNIADGRRRIQSETIGWFVRHTEYFGHAFNSTVRRSSVESCVDRRNGDVTFHRYEATVKIDTN